MRPGLSQNCLSRKEAGNKARETFSLPVNSGITSEFKGRKLGALPHRTTPPETVGQSELRTPDKYFRTSKGTKNTAKPSRGTSQVQCVPGLEAVWPNSQIKQFSWTNPKSDPKQQTSLTIITYISMKPGITNK